MSGLNGMRRVPRALEWIATSHSSLGNSKFLSLSCVKGKVVASSGESQDDLPGFWKSDCTAVCWASELLVKRKSEQGKRLGSEGSQEVLGVVGVKYLCDVILLFLSKQVVPDIVP